MNDLYTRIEKLSPEQRTILVQKLNELSARSTPAGPERPAVTVDKRLIAYVVCETEAENTVSHLRDMLRETLPDHMMPTSFVLLDSLPLTPNGKVDRQALPEPEQMSSDHEYVAPRSETEEILAEIWAKVLRVDVVGVFDHFFELGGHSLLVTQTIARVRERFEIDLPLRTLFEAPTIAEFVVVLEQKLIAELEALSEEEAQQALEEAD